MICGFALTLLAAPAGAQQEPQWELGLGVGVTGLPDYRGADEGHTYILPIPYFVYRGDALRVDRSGVHSDLVLAERVSLDVSLGLGPPARTKDNSTRTGMPDLDPTLEFGPSLRWLWYENAPRDTFVAFHLPVRAVVATNFRYTHDLGWIVAPSVVLDVLNLGAPGLTFSAGLGPLYATEKYHDYYYQVTNEFATPTRPAYDAHGGYSGTRLTLTLSKRFDRLWIGSFVRYDYLRGATFDDSPLVKQDYSLMAGVGVSYVFAHSEKMVDVLPDLSRP